MKQTWNKKVAAKRGKKWKAALVVGRLEAERNPTLLRVARARRAMSQTKVANSLGLSYGTYGAIETGKRPLTRQRAYKIIKLLGLKFDDAFKYVDEGRDGDGRYVANRAPIATGHGDARIARDSR